MRMTRKDFELIAGVFADATRRMRPEPDGDLAFMHRVLAEDLADTLRRTNERFDRDRFLAACGVAPV